ncbi:serine/threonine protein kinase, partial [Microtetraspora sp. AC03309]|nr:serine/threonine protein kinase [Microtetraspora sp. AC03309]
MGEVWQATDELLGREVAVKLLRQHVAADPSFRERFRNEARITAGLTDPGIAQVFDYGESDGVAYLIMELVSGEPLSGILRRNGSLSPEVTLDVIGQVAKALHSAHRAGIIHRDIKPGNLLVTETGVVKVTDFGIARALEAAPVTQSGVVLGTAQYVSPEQASGSTLTPATDVYSLGVVAYECLAGRPPFSGETQVAIALHHLYDPPPPLPAAVPARVRELVLAMLAKDPEARPAGTRELAERAVTIRESLSDAHTVMLGTLTDPAWFAVGAPAHGPTHGPISAPATPPAATRAASAAVSATAPRSPAPSRRRRRRTTTVVFATAGCAAAVGLGALAVRGMQAPRGPEGDLSSVTAVPTVESPTARPPRPATPTASPSRERPKSTRPSPSASATVSRSASPTPKPTPSPTPTPKNTPTPTPT